MGTQFPETIGLLTIKNHISESEHINQEQVKSVSKGLTTTGIT